jgi:hypothetical protein
MLISIFSLVYAQEQVNSIGLTGGFNVGYLTGEDADLGDGETGARLGFNAGLYGEFALHPIITLQPEVLFTQKGETIDFEGLVDASVDIELSYVEIPVLANVYWPVESATRPYVYAGPFVGFNLDANTDNLLDLGIGNFTSETDLEKDANTVESGVVVGAGLARIMENNSLSFDIRWTQGLTKVFDNDSFDEAYTGTLAAQVGIGFNL